MKVWRFYKSPSDEVLKVHQNSDLSIEDRYPLYAFTNDKNLAKEFMETRNMDRFIKFKSEMEKEDYVAFANSNAGCLLKLYSYEHYQKKYPDKKGDMEKIKIKLVSTWSEKEILQASLDDNLTEEMYNPSYNTFPFILEEKYIKALSVLQYISFWKLGDRADYYEDLLTIDEYNDTHDYIYPEVVYDELSKFIDLYGDTLL